MSEAIEDPHAYTRLTDFVLQQIMTSTDKNLNEVCVPYSYVYPIHCVLLAILSVKGAAT